MGYGIALHTAATDTPVSLAEAIAQVRVPEGTHDQELLRLITAATKYVQDRLNRQLVTATWNLYLDRFPCGSEPILIPKAPLQSVTSITYLDAAGDSQTWTSSNYRVSTTREPGRIVPVVGQVYPTTRNTTDAVTIRFVAGYGAATAVPQEIKLAILLLIDHWFENHSPVGKVGDAIAFSLESLLASASYGDEFTVFGYEREVAA